MALPLIDLWFGPPPSGNDPSAGDHRATFNQPGQGPRAGAVHDDIVTDPTLVARIRAGDVTAFGQLYTSTFHALWGFAATLLGGRDGAEDVVQDVFLDLWHRRGSWNVQGSVRGYLFGAVRNRVATLRQRTDTGARVTAQATVHSTPPLPPDSAAENADVARRIRAAIDALPPRQRDAVLLRWLGELNAAEIGRQLGVSDTAARKLLLKADATLRTTIGSLTD